MDISNLLNWPIPSSCHDAVPWVLLVGYAVALVRFKFVRKVTLIVLGAVLILQWIFDALSIARGGGGGVDVDE
jgi:hypothetical protein